MIVINTLIGIVVISMIMYASHVIGKRIVSTIQKLDTPLSTLDHVVSVIFGAMFLSLIVLLARLAYELGSSITAPFA